MAFYFGSIAQLVERPAVNRKVTGSKPVGPATIKEQAPFIKNKYERKVIGMVDYYYSNQYKQPLLNRYGDGVDCKSSALVLAEFDSLAWDSYRV